MNNSTSKITLKLGKLSFSYHSNRKPPADGNKLSPKMILLLLITTAVVVCLGTAAVAKDPDSFAAVATVWIQIKPILLLLLKVLK
jgi:hypothetical protein